MRERESNKWPGFLAVQLTTRKPEIEIMALMNIFNRSELLIAGQTEGDFQNGKIRQHFGSR